LTGLPADSTGTYTRYHVYRTTVWDTTFLLVANVAMSAGTTYTDTTADSLLGGSLPIPNSTQVVATATTSTNGKLSSGLYRYRVTFLSADGSTESNFSDDISVTLGQEQNQVVLSQLPRASGNYTQRRIYRTEAGLDTFHLLATIAASTTTYTDSAADT